MTTQHKISDLLKQAKQVIADEENWTQRVLARNAENYMVAVDSAAACKFCSIGAILKVIYPLYTETYVRDTKYALLRNCLLDTGYSGSLGSYNDTHTHAQVMQMWDKAIQLVEADEQQGAT